MDKGTKRKTAPRASWIIFIALLSSFPLVLAQSPSVSYSLVTEPVEGVSYASQCLTECHLPLRITFTDGYSVSEENDFSYVLVDGIGDYGFQSVEFRRLTDVAEEIESWNPNIECSPYDGLDENGTSSAIANCTDNGAFVNTTINRQEWQIFDPSAFVFSAGQEYVIDLVARRKASLAPSAIDAQFCFGELCTTEYAWWNASYSYRYNLTASQSGRLAEVFTVNVSAFNGSLGCLKVVQDDTTEISYEWYHDNGEYFANDTIRFIADGDDGKLAVYTSNSCPDGDTNTTVFLYYDGFNNPSDNEWVFGIDSGGRTEHFYNDTHNVLSFNDSGVASTLSFARVNLTRFGLNTTLFRSDWGVGYRRHFTIKGSAGTSTHVNTDFSSVHNGSQIFTSNLTGISTRYNPSTASKRNYWTYGENWVAGTDTQVNLSGDYFNFINWTDTSGTTATSFWYFNETLKTHAVHDIADLPTRVLLRNYFGFSAGDLGQSGGLGWHGYVDDLYIWNTPEQKMFLYETANSLTVDGEEQRIVNVSIPTLTPDPAFTTLAVNGSTIFSESPTQINGTVFGLWYVDGFYVYNETFYNVTDGAQVNFSLATGNFSYGTYVNLSVYADSGGLNTSVVWSNTVQVLWPVTFNVTSSEFDTTDLDNVNITCNGSFSQGGDTTNLYGPFGFLAGNHECTFNRGLLDDYYGNTTEIYVSSEAQFDIILDKKDSLTEAEHIWLGELYDCLYAGMCDSVQILEYINETAANVWNQFKRTDESVVCEETIVNTVVNSTHNLTIDWCIDVPEKEDYRFLPIRLSYWFLNETNVTCYDQNPLTNDTVTPSCHPVLVESVGEVNTKLNFTAILRPVNLPGSGNYTIVRRIEIDPPQNGVPQWINYGQEVVGTVQVVEEPDGIVEEPLVSEGEVEEVYPEVSSVEKANFEDSSEQPDIEPETTSEPIVTAFVAESSDSWGEGAIALAKLISRTLLSALAIICLTIYGVSGKRLDKKARGRIGLLGIFFSVFVLALTVVSPAIAPSPLAVSYELVTEPIEGVVYTPDCLVECHLPLRITFAQDYAMDSTSDFSPKFIDGRGDYQLDTVEFRQLVTTNVERSRWIKDIQCSPWEEEVDNGTATRQNCTDHGYEEKFNQTVLSWESFDPVGKTLSADQEYVIDLVGIRRARLSDSGVDAQFCFGDRCTVEYAWWNTSYKYRYNLTFDHTGRRVEPISVNMSTINGSLHCLKVVQSDTTEIEWEWWHENNQTPLINDTIRFFADADLPTAIYTRVGCPGGEGNSSLVLRYLSDTNTSWDWDGTELQDKWNSTTNRADFRKLEFSSNRLYGHVGYNLSAQGIADQVNKQDFGLYWRSNVYRDHNDQKIANTYATIGLFDDPNYFENGGAGIVAASFAEDGNRGLPCAPLDHCLIVSGDGVDHNTNPNVTYNYSGENFTGFLSWNNVTFNASTEYINSTDVAIGNISELDTPADWNWTHLSIALTRSEELTNEGGFDFYGWFDDIYLTLNKNRQFYLYDTPNTVTVSDEQSIAIITFNVTSSEPGNLGLDGVSITCNYSEFSQGGDVTNTYGPYGFEEGNWECTFTKAAYHDEIIVFAADQDATIEVNMDEELSLTDVEHFWLEGVRDCLYEGNCHTMSLIEEINESVHNTWNLFKQTNESVVCEETIVNTEVNSTHNLTIDWCIDVPTKEDYLFLPIRLSYWFLNETNVTCYDQDPETNSAETPRCFPVLLETVGQVNTKLNFTAVMRPKNLPGSGNYTIVRRIEIDPPINGLPTWINYGQEGVGSFEYIEGEESLIAAPNEEPAIEELEVQETDSNLQIETTLSEEADAGLAGETAVPESTTQVTGSTTSVTTLFTVEGQEIAEIISHTFLLALAIVCLTIHGVNRRRY